MHTEASITIDRAIGDVFKITNNEVAAWSLTVIQDDVKKCTLDVVGTTFRTVTDNRGKELAFDGVITEWQPPTRSRVRLTGTSFNLDVTYRFEAIDANTTQVSVSTEVDPKGFAKLMFVLFGWMLGKQGCDAQLKELESLKRHVETRAPAAS